MISAEAKFILALPSGREARVIYGSLKPELPAGSSDRAEVRLHLTEDDTLGLDILAADTASLRACVNTYSRWIGMVKSLMEV